MFPHEQSAGIGLNEKTAGKQSRLPLITAAAAVVLITAQRPQPPRASSPSACTTASQGGLLNPGPG